MVHLVDTGDGHAMECNRCGAQAPFDADLPYVKQMASFDTDHGCPAARRSETTDDAA